MTREELETIETCWSEQFSKEFKNILSTNPDPRIKITVQFIQEAVIAKFCHEKLELLCAED